MKTSNILFIMVGCCMLLMVGFTYFLIDAEKQVEEVDCFDEESNKIQGLVCEDESFVNPVHKVMLNIMLSLVLPLVIAIVAGILFKTGGD